MKKNPCILLEFNKIDCIGAIIPPIKCVQNSKSNSIPEQEVLLNRGASFKIVAVNTIQGMRVIQLEALQQTKTQKIIALIQRLFFT